MAKVHLTPEEFRKLSADERAVSELLPDLDQLEKCGADCSILRQTIMQTMDYSKNLREYFKPPNTLGYQ